MTKFLNQALVKTLIEAQGNKAVTVTFAKKNGDVTTKNGLPKVYKRRVGGDAGAKQAQVLKDNGLLFFDYVKPKIADNGKPIAGFSFFTNRVLEIRANGAVIASAE